MTILAIGFGAASMVLAILAAGADRTNPAGALVCLLLAALFVGAAVLAASGIERR